MALTASACGGGEQQPLPRPPPQEPPTTAASAAPVPTASAMAVGSASAVPEGRPPSAPDPFAGKPFPPEPVEPMHARTAEEGDGQWKPVADDVGGAPAMAQMTIHPHPIKKWVFVTFVAFDRKRVELSLQAGTQEPESDQVPEDQRSGLVPEGEQARLLAVFNGGFKAKHGNYGMKIGADLYVPPKEQACAVTAYPDGALQIGSWPALSSRASKARFYRQTPPCLLEGGKRGELLKSEHRSRWWGSAKGGKLDIRRSALALSPSGRSIVYAFGDWISANDLTDALQAAGIRDAAQLDINWSYTRFFYFEHPDGEKEPRIRETIIPEVKFSRNRYVSKSSYRDFFYVTKKPSALK